MADISTREIIYGSLISKGEEFKGLELAADNLDENPAKIKLAFAYFFSPRDTVITMEMKLEPKTTRNMEKAEKA